MKRLIILLAIGLISFTLKAQEGTVMVVNYMPSIPFGETAEFTNNISPRGVEFEANKFLNESLSVGFVVGWTVFREKITGETFDYRDFTVTGTQFRYTNISPVNLNIKKYFGGNMDLKPFAGVGVGTAYAKRTNDVGVFSINDDKWLFNVAPEIGMFYDVNYRSKLSVKLKYNYSPKAGDFPAMSYLSLGVGIGLN
jgi:opacity protein-like surface antigen